MNPLKRVFQVQYLLAAGLILLQLPGCSNIHRGIPPSGSAPKSQPTQFEAGALEGYWRCRNDDVEVHITNVGPRSMGNGSYKDVSGRIIPAGKFTGIRFLGNNRWSCEQWIQRPGQFYDSQRGRWESAIIEMLDINTIRVGYVIYTRN